MANFVYNSKLAPVDGHVSAKTLGNATDVMWVQDEPENMGPDIAEIPESPLFPRPTADPGEART